jgi:hypothetical protein
MGGEAAAPARLYMTGGWVGRIRYKEREMERDRHAFSLGGGTNGGSASVGEGQRWRPLEHLHGTRELQGLHMGQEGVMSGL